MLNILNLLPGGEILLGLYQFDKSYKTNITCTSVWIASGSAVCASGVALATRTASGTSRSLDLGYVYPIGDMSVGGGIALPVLGELWRICSWMDHTWKCPFLKDCEWFRHNRKTVTRRESFFELLPQFWLLNWCLWSPFELQVRILNRGVASKQNQRRRRPARR